MEYKISKLTDAAENAREMIDVKARAEKWTKKGNEKMATKWQGRYEDAIANTIGVYFVSGEETFTHKEALKEAGFKWFSNYSLWYSFEAIEINIDGLEVFKA